MKILIDRDVLLDVALERKEHVEASSVVLQWAETHPGQTSIAWHSLSNLIYLCDGNVQKFIRDLLVFVEVAPTSTNLMLQALDYAMGDLEDAMQAAAAIGFGANMIVTRNNSGYRRSPVKAITPEEFCKNYTV